MPWMGAAHTSFGICVNALIKDRDAVLKRAEALGTALKDIKVRVADVMPIFSTEDVHDLDTIIAGAVNCLHGIFMLAKYTLEPVTTPDP